MLARINRESHSMDPTITLAPCGGLRLDLGGHSITIKVGPTQADYALAMSALLRLLRDRAANEAPTIATPGAVTQEPMQALLRTMRNSPEVRRIAPGVQSKTYSCV